MTDQLRKLRRRVIVLGALVILAVGGVVLAKKNGPGSDVVEVRLVARDMAYFVEGRTEPNPTLRVPRGARLRVVLTNDDPGYSHNLIVSAFGVESPLIVKGTSQAIEMRVPLAPGVHAYSCGPHAEMMRGNIAVE
ncbi:MAG: hypothetical protein ABIX28_02710 [Vicinamibacterales bacterium]